MYLRTRMDNGEAAVDGVGLRPIPVGVSLHGRAVEGEGKQQRGYTYQRSHIIDPKLSTLHQKESNR